MFPILEFLETWKWQGIRLRSGKRPKVGEVRERSGNLCSQGNLIVAAQDNNLPLLYLYYNSFFIRDVHGEFDRVTTFLEFLDTWKCICSIYFLQYHLEKSGIFFSIKTGQEYGNLALRFFVNCNSSRFVLSLFQVPRIQFRSLDSRVWSRWDECDIFGVLLTYVADPSGWWRGRLRGREGLFPNNYVQKLWKRLLISCLCFTSTSDQSLSSECCCG